MLSPIEAIGFNRCVMASFENREFVSNWERLRKKEIKRRGGNKTFRCRRSGYRLG